MIVRIYPFITINRIQENYTHIQEILDISIINQDKIINKELRLQYLSLDAEPINDFLAAGYITYAFPYIYLFPRGTRLVGISQTRDIKLTFYQ